MWDNYRMALTVFSQSAGSFYSDVGSARDCAASLATQNDVLILEVVQFSAVPRPLNNHVWPHFASQCSSTKPETLVSVCLAALFCLRLISLAELGLTSLHNVRPQSQTPVGLSVCLAALGCLWLVSLAELQQTCTTMYRCSLSALKTD